MTVMEFRTGGPQREPRGPGVLAGLRARFGRSGAAPVVGPAAPDADPATVPAARAVPGTTGAPGGEPAA